MGALETGLVEVYTGDGKGKTTAAAGLAVRARGHDLAVCFIQFVKGGEPSGELEGLRRLGVEVVRPAERSAALMEGEPDAEDRRAAAEAWEAASRALASGEWDLVVLDEVCVALRYGLVSRSLLLEALAARPAGVEVVCTGRWAPAALLGAADLVTEMRVVEHPFDTGMKARPGIEY